MTSHGKPDLTVALDLRLAGYRGGGIPRYARELSSALQSIPGIRPVGLYSIRDRQRDRRATTLYTPPHHRLEAWSIPVELLLRRLRPDVYHAPDFIAPHLPGVPRVATVHDLAFLHWPRDLAPDALGYYRQLQQSKRRTSAWITPSRWTAEQLATIYDIDCSTIHVIPHGVSLDLLASPPLPRSARGDYILAVGTVEPRKQYDILIDALERSAAVPRLVVAGQTGWNSTATERRLESSGRVTWLTDARDEELRRLYREAIALAIPSRAEGFGLSALEAMAVGTPVVSSGGGALPEVTGEAALQVDDPVPDNWAEALERITSDRQLWEARSAAGRERAATFSWERAAQATATVYQSVRT